MVIDDGCEGNGAPRWITNWRHFSDEERAGLGCVCYGQVERWMYTRTYDARPWRRSHCRSQTLVVELGSYFSLSSSSSSSSFLSAAAALVCQDRQYPTGETHAQAHMQESKYALD